MAFPVVFAVLALVPAIAQDPVRIAPAALPLTTVVSSAEKDGRVVDVQRLIDGRLLIVRMDPASLQIYGRDGVLQRDLVRAAPTERFKGPLSLLESSAAGLRVSDAGDGTISRYSPTGVLSRTEPIKPSDGTIRFLIHRNTLLHDLNSTSIGCVQQAVAAWPMGSAGTLREARFDPAGRFWVRMPGTSEWMVGSVDGQSIARVVLPAGFILYQIGDGYVAGKTVTEDGERVQVLAMRFPGPAPAPPACLHAATELKPDLERTDLMRAMLLAGAARMRKARGVDGTFSSDSASVFAGMTAFPGLTLRIVQVGPRGFALMSARIDGTQRCLLAFGDAYPGFPENYALCGT